jgi:cation diffusion facilitator family transporter
MSFVHAGLKASAIAIGVNTLLAAGKIVTGIAGNSYALIADGIESTADVFSSIIVWSGLRYSARPPDRTHPYGHGKAESMAAVVVSVFLIGAAILIAVQSIHEIITPHHAPAWYTLPVLVIIVAIKESMYRFMSRVGTSIGSSALKGDAWHHRSDALTSFAAFIGISIALVGGAGYETADDWAALAACTVILYNGVRLLRPAFDEVMDAAVPYATEEQLRNLARSVEGVVDVEKCRIRKSGTDLLMDIHVTVNGELTVREGHEIAQRVRANLVGSRLRVTDVVVHIEPDVF